MKFTTSWDDGYTLDLRLAEMLARHRVTGTFYVCPARQHDQTMLSESQIKDLSASFEIGSHTLTHPRLTAVPEERARLEIADSKAWIEGVTGVECPMFCYPKGDESPAIRAMVKEAGYRGARTTQMLRFSVDDPFGMPTTLHVYPFPWRQRFTRWWHPLDPLARLRIHWGDLRRIGVPLSSCGSFLSLAEALWEKAVEKNEPVFHLWGHSEEVKRLGLWEDLDRFLGRVAATPGIECVTNGSLL